jgi:hypothetical protein
VAEHVDGNSAGHRNKTSDVSTGCLKRLCHENGI